jgi:hypothetical protein
VAIGGIVEIAPLFWIDNTIEKVEGMRPYTPLEQAGRDIYIREGCYTCHSQMIRPFRDEVERYGHYSLAAESMYDHPFQWGSNAPGRIWRGSAGAIRMNGMSSTSRTRAAWCPKASCQATLPRRNAAESARSSRPRCVALRGSACPTAIDIDRRRKD